MFAPRRTRQSCWIPTTSAARRLRVSGSPPWQSLHRRQTANGCQSLSNYRQTSTVPPSLSGIENAARISAAGVSRGAYTLADPLDEADLFGRLTEEGLDVLRDLGMPIAKEPLSLETPIGDEEDSHLGDFIEDKSAILPIDAAIQSNLRETTTRVLASLTPREERIVRMRFGIGMNADHTLEEVGQQFSLTRERIRQIEARALRKLKHPSRSSALRSFLNN